MKANNVTLTENTLINVWYIKELFIPPGDISISAKVFTYNYPGYVVNTRNCKQQRN